MRPSYTLHKYWVRTHRVFSTQCRWHTNCMTFRSLSIDSDQSRKGVGCELTFADIRFQWNRSQWASRHLWTGGMPIYTHTYDGRYRFCVDFCFFQLFYVVSAESRQQRKINSIELPMNATIANSQRQHQQQRFLSMQRQSRHTKEWDDGVKWNHIQFRFVRCENDASSIAL